MRFLTQSKHCFPSENTNANPKLPLRKSQRLAVKNAWRKTKVARQKLRSLFFRNAPTNNVHKAGWTIAANNCFRIITITHGLCRRTQTLWARRLNYHSLFSPNQNRCSSLSSTLFRIKICARSDRLWVRNSDWMADEWWPLVLRRRSDQVLAVFWARMQWHKLSIWAGRPVQAQTRSWALLSVDASRCSSNQFQPPNRLSTLWRRLRL